jgi:hypothetical protein
MTTDTTPWFEFTLPDRPDGGDVAYELNELYACMALAEFPLPPLHDPELLYRLLCVLTAAEPFDIFRATHD